MELFIGSKPHGHDASIYAYIPSSNKKFAISTERITRIKHDHSTFLFALDFFLNSLDKNFIKKIKKIYLGISFNSYKGYHPVNNIVDGKFSYANAFLTVLNFRTLNKIKNEKIYTEYFKEKFGSKLLLKFYYFDHEYCHNLSSIISSNFKNCLSISMDGMGDYKNFSSVYLKKGDDISLIKKYYSTNNTIKLFNKNFPFSLPGLYEFFTFLVGLKPNSEEGKVEALAAYGKKIAIYDEIKKLVHFDKKKNEIILNYGKLKKIFSYKNCLEIKKKFKQVDLCWTIQKLSEEVVLDIVEYYNSNYKFDNITLSGGFFANVIINLKIFEKFNKKMHVVPAMADDGTAEGACYALLLKYKKKIRHSSMPYYGPRVKKREVINTLKINNYGYNYKFKSLGNRWCADAAKKICDNKIISVFHGKMEWGPRALGNRSILANPNYKKNHLKLNQNIKGRPLYQPFCPMILEEDMSKMFNNYYNNYHMTCAFRMKNKYASKYPVAVHIDKTSRVQVVTKNTNLAIYNILKNYKKNFGEGIIINTSFNKHGRTIVCTVNDAIFDFFDSNLDHLYIEGVRVDKV